ncbi:MAG: sigma-70 family RNA polymerase sigma factor [Acidobacteria bacterium]|nr:sigma-70 family RNA polymerase sigma factor [Acidobacteriota bacterium]
MNSSSDVTQLLEAMNRGEQSAFDELLPVVYDELHRIAERYMARQQGHTLQTTALINEAYLRMASQEEKHWENRTHFFATAATIMRHILVDHARSRQRDKRGGRALKVSFDEALAKADEAAMEITVLDEALRTLSAMDQQQARIVELRFFGGLTMEEIAEVLAVSLSTVEREWRSARAWLNRELRK